jgi:exportin-1
MLTIFTKGFETVNRTQLEAVIPNMFNRSDNWPEFVQVIRDFLISLKEFAGEDASLYEPERQQAIEDSKKKEEATRTAVPGLVPQYDPARLADDMDD